MIKKCSVCKTIKPISEYGKDTASKDGHSYRCKKCARDMNKIYRMKNPEKIKRKNERNSEKYKMKRENLIAERDSLRAELAITKKALGISCEKLMLNVKYCPQDIGSTAVSCGAYFGSKECVVKPTECWKTHFISESKELLCTEEHRHQ